MASTRQLYETAFDSSASPVDEAAEGAEHVLEASRRLCSSDPPQRSLRPSPASSRSSTDSERTSGRSPFSPKIPLRKFFTPWLDRKTISVSEPSTSAAQSSQESSKEDKTFSPSVEFKKLDFGDENKKSEVNAPATSGVVPRASSLTHSESARDRDLANAHPSSCFTRLPLDDWGTNNQAQSSVFQRQEREAQAHPHDDNLHIAWKIPAFKAPREEAKRSSEDSSMSRNNLWLDFNRASKRQRRHLHLDINVEEDSSNNSVKSISYLQKQGWYHGSISRADAEDLLRLLKKGSYLVRCSEKLKRQYLLSLKSSRGVMHVKIVQLPSGKFVIKQQSECFDSIPQLVQHFSSHVLNIHEMNVYLAHPVIEKLL